MKSNFSTAFNVSVYINNELKLGNDIGSLSAKNIMKVRRVGSMLNESGKEELANVDVYVYQN
jgi:hypothetical protein